MKEDCDEEEDEGKREEGVEREGGEREGGRTERREKEDGDGEKGERKEVEKLPVVDEVGVFEPIVSSDRCGRLQRKMDPLNIPFPTTKWKDEMRRNRVRRNIR